MHSPIPSSFSADYNIAVVYVAIAVGVLLVQVVLSKYRWLQR